MPKNFRIITRGTAVRRARLLQNITEGELATLVKVSRQTISRVENGHGASATLAHRLASKLGKSFDELFEIVEMKNNGNSNGSD